MPGTGKTGNINLKAIVQDREVQRVDVRSRNSALPASSSTSLGYGDI